MMLAFTNGCAAFNKVSTAGLLQPIHKWLWANIIVSYKRDKISHNNRTQNMQEFFSRTDENHTSTKWEAVEQFYKCTQESTLKYEDVVAILTNAGVSDSTTHNSVAEYLRIPLTRVHHEEITTNNSVIGMSRF
jgi:ribose 1,5-bisphosphokinase PhnN